MIGQMGLNPSKSRPPGAVVAATTGISLAYIVLPLAGALTAHLWMPFVKDNPFFFGVLGGMLWILFGTLLFLLNWGLYLAWKEPRPNRAEPVAANPDKLRVQPAPPAGALFATLQAAFKKAGWKYRCASEQSVDFEFLSEHGVIEGHANVRERFGQLLVYSQSRYPLPPEYRGAMAEFLTQVNYALPIGNFEMDFRDGLVRFKTSLSLGEDGCQPPLSMVVELVEMNIATMSLYLPGILAVGAGQEPLKALALVEDVPEPKADFASRRVYLN